MDQGISNTKINRSAASLFISNVLSFSIVGFSYVIYSRILTPGEFGLYSIALALASIGSLVLDSGLKNTLIKAKFTLTRIEEGTLLFLMCCLSIAAISLLLFIKNFVVYNFPSISSDYQFLAIFSGIYWLSYPLIIFPTASLERKFSYDKLSFVESIGMALERALPVILLTGFNQGIYSFIWSALIGRLFKVILLCKYHPPHLCIPSFNTILGIRHILHEGFWIQSATLISLLRDNLHILLVGVMFGKDWVGYYAWGLQMCLIASQVFVQMSARISIPVFSQTASFEEMWLNCIRQIKLLAIFTIPLLVTLLLIIPTINIYIFDNRWTNAIPLIPLLFARMLPGLATTPIGSLIMVYRGGNELFKAVSYWTFLEFLIGLIALLILGPMGLAWSYAIVVWVGLFIFISQLSKDTIELSIETSLKILGRPSLLISGGISIIINHYSAVNSAFSLSSYLVIAMIFLIAPLSYLSEPLIRNFCGQKYEQSKIKT